MKMRVALKTDSSLWTVRLLVVPSEVSTVRYVIFMIQRRSGTLRL